MSQTTRLFYPLKNAQPGFELVPLKATANGVLGKTVANGLADHLKAALVGAKKNGPPYFLVACAGQSRRQIQELSTDERTPESRRDGGGAGITKRFWMMRGGQWSRWGNRSEP